MATLDGLRPFYGWSDCQHIPLGNSTIWTVERVLAMTLYVPRSSKTQTYHLFKAPKLTQNITQIRGQVEILYTLLMYPSTFHLYGNPLYQIYFEKRY